MARILEALPKCCVPFVSFSGKKGWHVWLFLSEPVEVEVAFRFAESIREKAGVACEVYPTGRKSTRCLKWLLSFHPETGKQEVFVPQEDLTDTTTSTLRFFRVWKLAMAYPSDGSLPVCRNRPDRRRKTEFLRQRSCNSDETFQKTLHHREKTPPDGVNLQSLKSPLALLNSVGDVSPALGKHSDAYSLGTKKATSASFWRGDNGTIVYHCFHHEKHGTSEFLILGEVYHAVSTGRIQSCLLLKPQGGCVSLHFG